MAYIGKSPSGTGVRQRYYFTATGGETSLSGTDDKGLTLSYTDGAYVDVLLNGIELVAGTDYNTSTANTIAGLAALAASDVVTVTVYDIFTVADTVSAKDGGTFSGNVVMNADLTIDTDTLYVDSTNDRVGIGTTSPSWDVHAYAQSGSQTSTFEAESGNVTVRFTSGDGDRSQMLFGDQTNDTISIIRHENADNSLQFYTEATKRMEINSYGNFLLGANYISTGTKLNVQSDDSFRASDIYRSTSTSTSHIANFYSDVSGTQTLQQVMEASGDIESRTSSLTGTSDRTLKENIVDATAQWDDIKALDFKNFNFIGEPDRTMLGVIAQDVQAAGMTGLVKTNQETGKLSVKYSVMFMKAVIALQEAMTKIETLETEMTALEARVTALETA